MAATKTKHENVCALHGTRSFLRKISRFTVNQLLQVCTISNKEGMVDHQPDPEQSTLTTITTDDSSTLVPGSPSSPGHSRHIPDLTITDLHTTTMSSMREDVPRAKDAIVGHQSSSEDSDSSSGSTDSETPPPQLGRLTAQPVHTHTPQLTTAAQKVRFSPSTKQREKARHGSSSSTRSSEQSGIEVGDISSIQLKLGLDSQVAQSRANVLATLYQNYLRELRTAQPVTKGTPKVTNKMGAASTKSKLKSYPRPTSKVMYLDPILCKLLDKSCGYLVLTNERREGLHHQCDYVIVLCSHWSIQNFNLGE